MMMMLKWLRDAHDDDDDGLMVMIMNRATDDERASDDENDVDDEVEMATGCA